VMSVKGSRWVREGGGSGLQGPNEEDADEGDFTLDGHVE